MTPWRRMLPTFLAARTDLYTLGEEYAASVAVAGGLPMILPHLDPGSADEVLDGLDGVVLCGGDDVDPATYGAVDQGGNHLALAGTDAWELALARRAVDRGIPVLGICRGLQVLNVALGGTLHQHVAVEGSAHPPTPVDPEAVMAQRHPIAIAPGSRLAGVYGVDQRVVNTIHHQAVDRLGDGLEAVAWAPDGIVEAVEAVDPAVEILAVQWHPEKMPDDSERPLFVDFIARVAVRRTSEDGVTPGR